MRRLRSLGQSLRKSEAHGAAWASLPAQAAPLRAELDERLQPLDRPPVWARRDGGWHGGWRGPGAAGCGFVTGPRNACVAEREAEAAQATEREQEMERWRVKCVQEVEEKKREQKLQAAAYFAEVRQKQSDTKRMADILRALGKPRKEAAAASCFS